MAHVFELEQRQKDELRTMFGRWVALDGERRYYDHDIGVFPSLVKPFIGRTVPAAVVKAMNEEDVVKLLTWANRENVPVVPRAAASSGYGGVVPAAGGIVLDVTSLRRVVEVDSDNRLVTVEAGIVWEDLERKLAEHGLAPRKVPSSAPASTVGGWFMQSGAGYGSFAYGWFDEDVVSVRYVAPDGSVHEASGDDLKSLYGSMGTIGVVTRLTLRVKPLVALVPRAYAFPDAKSLATAVQETYRAELPLNTLNFINPGAAALKNASPLKTHHGHPVEERVLLPESYILLAVAEETDAERAFEALDRIVAEAGGERLSDEVAAHEWDERYKPMKLKRLGPSIIPAEVVVPLNSLYMFLSDIEHALRLPYSVEGISVKGNEIVLLFLIPHDERKFSFNFAFALSLTVLKTALRYGGRPYSGGLYFGGYRNRVFGRERLAAIEAAKRSRDPRGIMNPYKLEGKPAIVSLLTAAAALEPIARALGNASRIELAERYVDQKGMPGDVVWFAYACAQCGYCVRECDQFYGRGWESESPRGKWYWMKRYLEGKERLTQEQVDTFLICTTCEMCSFRCQLDMPIEESWEKLRGETVQERGYMTFPPFEIMAASLRKERNIWASFARDRDAWVPEDVKPRIKDRAEIAYFAGCTASFVENDIGKATVTLLDRAGVEFTYLGTDEACCGIPMLVAGRWDVFEETMEHNMTKMAERGVKTVVTSCPACLLVWRQYYREWAEKKGIEYPFEAKHYSEVLAEKAEKGELPFEKEIPAVVTFHDSCHMGRALGVYEEPRALIQAIPGVELREMEYNRDAAHCCGSVLSLIGEPPVAYDLGEIRLNEAKATGADTVLAVCPCCQFQLRVSNEKKGAGVAVRDLASFACEALGVEYPDTTPDAVAMWVTFEAMIDLMKPEKMAGLMEKLFPQMFAAMPGWMVAMMKGARHVPGMLGHMEKMMPAMMPLLMPGIMPKVMPDMLAEVEKIVPMPDYMKEQMPDLMPAAMENLLPKMLPSIAPLVAPKMMAYVKEKL
jgi:Fe-S oxidoreductase/FAD/FMN-containing dehydrogenase